MLNKIKIKKLNMITLLRQLVISLLNSKNYAGQRRHLKDRSSRPKVFCKKGVLKNFTKFTGNHLTGFKYASVSNSTTLNIKRLKTAALVEIFETMFQFSLH